MWKVPKEWPGETVFIVAGGPSVTPDDVERLRGRRVMAINSSFAIAPWADYLIFGDSRWWHYHRTEARGDLPAIIDVFKGRIVTCSQAAIDVRPKRLHKLVRVSINQGLAQKPSNVVMRRTTLAPAINVSVHTGATRIVLLGADMRRGDDGRIHHHQDHQWKHRDACFDEQMSDLQKMRRPLSRLGIEVINCSTISRIDWWPKMSFDEVLSDEVAQSLPGS